MTHEQRMYQLTLAATDPNPVNRAAAQDAVVSELHRITARADANIVPDDWIADTHFIQSARGRLPLIAYTADAAQRAESSRLARAADRPRKK